jgi:hypothetical protein
VQEKSGTCDPLPGSDTNEKSGLRSMSTCGYIVWPVAKFGIERQMFVEVVMEPRAQAACIADAIDAPKFKLQA